MALIPEDVRKDSQKGRKSSAHYKGEGRVHTGQASLNPIAGRERVGRLLLGFLKPTWMRTVVSTDEVLQGLAPWICESGTVKSVEIGFRGACIVLRNSWLRGRMPISHGCRIPYIV